MISKNEKSMTSTVTCSLAEIPTVPGSEVKKSDTVTEWDVVPGIMVDTLDPVTMERVLVPMTKVSRHEGLKMFDCTLSSRGSFSHVVTASEDHSLITLNPLTMQFEKTRPEDAIGRCVPRLVGNEANVWGKCVETMRIDGKDYPLSYDFGMLLGMIIGDGWVDVQNTLFIAGIDKGVQAKILELTDLDRQLVPVLSKTAVYTYSPADRFSKDPAQRIDLHTRHSFNKALKERIGEYAWGKRIPAECLGGSTAHLIGLLMGLLSTDGTVSYAENTTAKAKKAKTVLYHTVSPELRDNVQDLCARLGIRTSATAYMGVNSKHTCYAVVLSITDLAVVARKHPKLFVLPMEDKQRALEKIILEVENSRLSQPANSPDIMPVPRCIYSELSYAKVLDASILCAMKKNGFMTRPAAERMIPKLRNVDWSGFRDSANLAAQDKLGHTPEEAARYVNAWIQWIETTDISWEVVKSVIPSTCTEGWDCTVPGPYTFTLASGTVVQDTVNIHVPVSDEARRETYDRMFPDRNLIAMRNRKIAFKPEKEYIQGLYVATRMKEGERPRIFDTLEDARRAQREGTLDVDDPIIIKGN